MKIIIYFVCIVCYSSGADETRFPGGFQFGASTSAYQIEGAWNLQGKGENIWDRALHARSITTVDNSTGDVACDSYHKYREDVALLKYLGVKFYRFSLSWSRIFPTGHSNRVNSDGVRYYNDLINTLIANGIQPYVTLYHWDLPQPLQEIGGLANPLIVKYFLDYAAFAFRNFGDRVKIWQTFNQPKTSCVHGYGTGLIPPMGKSDGLGDYICMHNLLKAHAATYHLYNDTFKLKQDGRLSITLDAQWQEPFSNSTKDISAAERMMQFELGWIANPIFHKRGDYPTVLKQYVGERSAREGYSHSRLPEFTKKDVNYIKGTFDFFGFNHYTTRLVMDDEEPLGESSRMKDAGVRQELDPDWPSGSAGWLQVVPWGIRKSLNWVKNKYNNPEIIIFENGFADEGEIEDWERVRYHELYLKNILLAIHRDNVRVTKYSVWSLLDNFEWVYGYTHKFGLYHVDFNHKNRKRTPKISASYYKDIIASRRLIPTNLTFWE